MHAPFAEDSPKVQVPILLQGTWVEQLFHLFAVNNYWSTTFMCIYRTVSATDIRPATSSMIFYISPDKGHWESRTC